ncbi:MAG: hypothetical protein AAF845_05120 [Bacteroidota bacterium]
MSTDAPVVEVVFDRTAAGTAPPEAAASEPTPSAAPSSAQAAAPVRPLLPSYAVVIIGGLALACLALSVALITALTQPQPIRIPDLTAAVGAALPGASEASDDTAADEPTPGATATPADFPAPPVPIPVDLITDLEAASSETLDVELNRLLAAIQHGFGTQSARLEPTLRSYVYRMTARFEWNPDTHRVAVTAPDPRLADARRVLLEDLFEDAIASGRLEIGTGTGPHALTLVTS